ncbi:MAG: ATP-binding cassette domain-containing protein, partial [Eubacteriales bacterium]|nr:ATP-binding cassette domain-containing protein [Eubacteriales bacterium]
MIAVQNLTKTFRVLKPAEGRFSAVRSLFAPVYTEKRAVDDLSFSIDDGEIVGYIGQNGAGKSTTIKMLAGILVPTAGTMRVNGLDPIADHNRHLLGIGTVFGQRTSLWWDVPLMDSLRILKEMYRVDDAVFRKNVEKFTDILELSGFLHQPVRQLSLGQRMRADLAAAMIHSPRVLFLDEPTIGLDVIARQRLREFIQEINRESGVTILLTTHDMVEMERLARSEE